MKLHTRVGPFTLRSVKKAVWVWDGGPKAGARGLGEISEGWPNRAKPYSIWGSNTGSGPTARGHRRSGPIREVAGGHRYMDGRPHTAVSLYLQPLASRFAPQPPFFTALPSLFLAHPFVPRFLLRDLAACVHELGLDVGISLVVLLARIFVLVLVLSHLALVVLLALVLTLLALRSESSTPPICNWLPLGTGARLPPVRDRSGWWTSK